MAARLFFSIIGGIVVALLTGLISNTPAMLVGAMHFGHPLAWLIRLVLAPEYFPWRVNLLNLIVDIIVWALVVFLVLLALGRIRKKQ